MIEFIKKKPTASIEMALVTTLLLSSNNAFSANLIIDENSIWAETADLSSAIAGDNVDITANSTFSIISDDIANDGSPNNGTFHVGNITNSAGTGALSIESGDYSGVVNITIDSADISGDANITYINGVASTGMSVNVSNDLTIDGNLVVANNEASLDEDLYVNIYGDLTVGGTTLLTSTDNSSNSTAKLLIQGDSNFIGGISIESYNFSNDAPILVLRGANNYGQIKVNDGQTYLYIDGLSTTPTIWGQINNGNMDGFVNIYSNGAIFKNNVSTWETRIYDDADVIYEGNFITSGLYGAGTATNGTGSVTFKETCGTVTIDGSLSSINTILRELNFYTDANVSYGSMYAADTTNINDNTLTIHDNFTIASGQELDTTISGDSSYGNITASGIASLSSDSIVNITVSYSPTDDRTYTIINGGSSSSIATLSEGNLIINGIASDSSGTITYGNYTWSQVANGEDLIVAVSVSDTITPTTPNSIKANAALLTIATNATGNSVLNTVNSNRLGNSTPSELNEFLETVTPEVDGSSQLTMLDLSRRIQSINNDRIAYLNSYTSGISSGDDYKMDKNAWIESYYSYADQDLSNNIDGYTSKSIGLIAGLDTEKIIDNGSLGIAISYGTTKANSEDGNKAETKINSTGLSLYSLYNIDSYKYLTGQLNFARNDISIDRKDCGGAGLNCIADTFSLQYSGNFSINLIKEINDKLSFTTEPYISSTKIYTNGYHETGNGAILSVKDSQISALNVGLNVKANLNIPTNHGNLFPSVTLGAAHDFIGDNVTLTSSFIGDSAGNSFTTTGGDPKKNQYLIGANFVYKDNQDWSVSAKYSAILKENYTYNNITAQYSIKF